MAYTDKFIKVPIKVFNTEQKELTGKEVLTDSWMKFDPSQIASYRPAEEDEYEATSIDFKTGDTITVCLPVEEFERRLNNYYR